MAFVRSCGGLTRHRQSPAARYKGFHLRRFQWDFWPARCEKSMMQAIIKASKAAEAEYLLNAKPPALSGLSRKSPTTAPRGRVRINAAQNNKVLEMFVQ